MKRIVSLLLTAVLLCTMFSVFVLPASAEAQTIPGTDITWELTENDTKLIIDGKGAMPNYDITTYEGRPWHSAAKTVTAVQINPGITTLGDYAFYLFEKMTSVTIPDGVTSIGDSAFNYCESLASVTIPYGVTSIGQYTFYSCANLQSVTIPSSVMNIDANAFYGCASLQSVTIPSSVTGIGDSAFRDCKSLQSVTIPYGVTSIEGSAFYGCANLQSVTIPPSVTRIKNDAFTNCTSLQSVTIPSSVTSIGSNAFQNCTSLQSVTIPSNVTSIGNSAFCYCNQLASVTVKTSTPPTLGKKVFDRTPDDLAIYVPCGAGTAYQEASGWSGKSGQIKEAYIVDDQPVGKGAVTVGKDCFPVDNFAEEQTVTVSVVPAEGYRLQADSLTAFYKDGEEEKTVELTQDETDPTKYSFEMPKANVTLEASFEAITDGTGSILSGGNLWIILGGVAAVLVAVIAALVVVKKKKKVNE